MANRAFYAMPYLSNRDKKPSGAVFGFANILMKLITDQKPDFLVVAFDHSRKTFRNEIYEGYKAKRKETPPDLIAQFPVIKEMLGVLGIKYFEIPGIEADDIIGTIAKNSDLEHILVSGDRDLLQLIDDNTSVWLTKKGVTDIEKYDEKALFEKFGLSPRGIVDLKALMGDMSDNIPGVPGVGEKTALSLLGDFGSLDGVYENIDKISGKLNEKLQNGKESAYMSQDLATIRTNCEIDFNLDECKFAFPFSQEVRDFFDAWDFRSLVNRKDLFLNGVGATKTEEKRICIEDVKQVEGLVLNVKDEFAYDLSKMEFSIGSGEVFYIKKEIDLFSKMVDFDEVLMVLKPVFENKKIVKITNSSKQDMKIMKKHDIELCNFFDIEIANYVLYAGLVKRPVQSTCEYFALKKELEKNMHEEGVFEIYSKIEIPLVSVLGGMEEEGFKIDEETLNALSQKYDAEIVVLTQKIYELADEVFNINSPKQVAAILFDKLGLKAFNNKKQSTSFAVLDDIRWQHEIVDLIIQYRKSSKLVSTYLNVYKKICETTGPVIHTIFNQTLTSTGRLSSSEPNMQNIPTRDEESKNLRKIFVSKYADGEIISADYNQIELRLLANLAEEGSMIDAYKKGIDIHTKTASEIFGVSTDKVTSSQRRDAKAVNFGIIYGISDFGLSQNIKTSKNKAKGYIESYFDRYPKIKTFMDANVEYAKEHGYVKSYFGRIRHIPEIQSANAVVRKFGERVAMNMPLQGTASDVIKLAMVELAKRLEGMESHLILQIHDELIVDAPASEVEKVKQILKESMENVCVFVVPLSVSVGSGKNLFECK
ncbi:MAG: DNA polymerase I [Clostridia bacterium]|nr:DNA polymerase I [Clostridia bacterium]